MPRAPVDIRAVHERILSSSQHLDAMVKNLLTSLGFTDVPANWPSEVERVLTALSGSARLVAVQQICATAHFFRDRQPREGANDRVMHIMVKGLELKGALDLLTGLTSLPSESFDPECCNIVRSHLPELSQKSAAFTEDVASLRAMEGDLALSYNVLATQRLDLEAALNAWLRIEIPGNLVLTSKVTILQLSMLADERRAIVDRAATLMSDLVSSRALLAQDDQARVYDDLRGLARSLAAQFSSHRLHLSAIANAVQALRSEFPALRVRDVEVPVRDLLAARCKHSVFEGRLAAMSERSEQLGQLSSCMLDIVRLDADLASYKGASASSFL